MVSTLKGVKIPALVIPVLVILLWAEKIVERTIELQPNIAQNGSRNKLIMFTLFGFIFSTMQSFHQNKIAWF